MKPDIDEIERKARAALGAHRWRVHRCHWAASDEACAIKDTPYVSAEEDANQSGVVYCTSRDECHHPMSAVEADHIASSDPAAVLALIARIRELESDR